MTDETPADRRLTRRSMITECWSRPAPGADETATMSLSHSQASDGGANATRNPLRLVIVNWSGAIGGAETLSVELAKAFRVAGAEPSVLFIGEAQPLAERLVRARIPYDLLGLSRGRHVLAHTRQLASAATGAGGDAAILPVGGYLAAALRVGGYRGAIIAVEHGSLLQQGRRSRPQRVLRNLDHISGVWACDAEVAVSEFVLDLVRKRPHARRLARIYNGVDLERFTPRMRGDGTKAKFVVGCTARLFRSKGVDELLRAFARQELRGSSLLRIAGDGPDRSRLEALATSIGIGDRVSFLGRIDDVAAFWHDCDLAVVPSREHIESFCLAAVEPMACALPVVATDNGALTEVVLDGRTGAIVPPGDAVALARAIARYRDDRVRREDHGRQARADAERRFDVGVTARSYLDLCCAVSADRDRGGSAA